MIESLAGGTAMPLPIRPTAVIAAAIVKAARQLSSELRCGRRMDVALLRGAMERAFGASDTTGVAWDIMAACEACYAAAITFLRRSGDALRAKSSHLSPALRCAAIIAVKGFRSFGTWSNDYAVTRCGEIAAGPQSISGRPHRRTGKM